MAPVSLEEGLRRTIDYEFVEKVQGGILLAASSVCVDNSMKMS